MRITALGVVVAMLAMPVQAGEPSQDTCIAYAEAQADKAAKMSLYMAAWRQGKVELDGRRYQQLTAQLYREYLRIYTGPRSKSSAVTRKLVRKQRQRCRDLYGL